MIDLMVKLMAEHKEAGNMYASSIKKLADFIADVVEESDIGERVQEDRKMMLLFSSSLSSIADSLAQMVKESDDIAQTFIEQKSREVKDVRQTKSECYQAFQESEAHKVKVIRK